MSITKVLRSETFLDRVTGPDVHRLFRTLDRRRREQVVTILGIPSTALRDAPDIDARLRRRSLSLVPARRLEALWVLTSTIRGDLTYALGDSACDPSDDELGAVLPEAVSTWGPLLVALTLGVIVDRDEVAGPACARALDRDRMFTPEVIGPVVVDTAGPAERARTRAMSAPADPATRAMVVEKRRERRRTRREERRSSAQVRRRYRRRVRTSMVAEDAAAPSVRNPALTIDLDVGPITSSRRRVRVVHRYPDLDPNHHLIGIVVWTTVRYGRNPGAKVRPVVVVAGSGPDHVVVRPIYRTKGFSGRDCRSIEIADLGTAGLTAPSVVSFEERRVPIARLGQRIGVLATDDWNQL
jgi:hypothetical protein